MGQEGVRAERRPVLDAAILIVAAIGLLTGGLVLVARETGAPQVAAAATPGAAAQALVQEKRVTTGIDAVLEARAAAVTGGRLDTFLSWLDPGNTKLKTSQTTVFANLRTLGLRNLSYRRQLPYVPEAIGKGRYRMRVTMLVQVRGVDAVPRMTVRVYTFAVRANRWRIIADSPDPGVTAIEPWDLGRRIEVVRRDHVTVIVDAGERAIGTQLAKQSVAALDAVRDIIGRGPAAILVVAVSDRRALGRVIAAEGRPAVAVARQDLSIADPDNLTAWRITGSRIIVNGADRQRATKYLLSHEFTHAAMAPLGPNAPLWLVEGLAEHTLYTLNQRAGYGDWVAEQRAKIRRKSIRELTVLPIDGLFRGSYGENSYATSWYITDYLVRRFGRESVLALYTDMAAAADDPRIREQLLRKHLGLGEAPLIAAIRKS